MTIEEYIKDLAKRGIHVSAKPCYFFRKQIGWQANIECFDPKVVNNTVLLGYDTKDSALRAGIDYIYKQLGL